MRLGLDAPPSEQVTIPRADRADTAALRVGAADDEVLLYLVASKAASDGDGSRSNEGGGW